MSKNIPELCYVFIHSANPGKRIGIIKRGESGYYPTDFDSPTASAAIAEQVVNRLNERLGVSPAHAEAMQVGSMFGWNVPGAQPELCN